MKVGDEKRGFTLIELLVVISVISVLMAILLPSLRKVRRQANAIVAANNQKEIVSATTIFASDNNERYPESVATVGFGNNWNWSDPTKLTGNTHRSPGVHRAMSEYLRSYIPDARTMYCPNAPQRYKYLQQAWDAGDAWDYPDDESFSTDPVGGTYCFYWNYTGHRLCRRSQGRLQRAAGSVERREIQQADRDRLFRLRPLEKPLVSRQLRTV